ncbi:MAG: oligosaccharide flippase family protein [Acidimicrobiales bacterium]
MTNIRWTLIGQMWTWSMAFVLATVLPRRLGAADVGRLYSSQAIWLIVAAIAAFGTDALIVRSAAADPATLGPIRRGALAARGLMLIVLWPVAAITLWVLGPRSLSVGLVVGVATSATVVGNVWRSILHGREQLAAIAAIDGG